MLETPPSPAQRSADHQCIGGTAADGVTIAASPWRPASMLTGRHEHGCVACQEKVYVTGGYCDKHLDSKTWICEIFTPPKSDDPADLSQWTYIAELQPGDRSRAYAITHANRLLFIGTFFYVKAFNLTSYCMCEKVS